MFRNIILVLFVLLLVNPLLGQDELPPAFTPQSKPIHSVDVAKLSFLQRYEDSLVHVADSMYTNDIPEVKESANREIVRMFKAMFKDNGSYDYNFEKLKNYITILDAPDKAFRIYNWEMERNQGYVRYYMVIQNPDGSIHPLVDVSDQIIRGGEDSIFNSKNYRWFGCLYYNIIVREIGNQNYYFLFGRNGNTLNSDKKIIEALHFENNGDLIFGAPLFSTIDRGERKSPMRFIYEYQKGSVLSMNFDPETNQIIFDHCESQIGDPAKKYTYIPDGTYDGMKWDGQQWQMFENIVNIRLLENGQAPVDRPIKK